MRMLADPSRPSWLHAYATGFVSSSETFPGEAATCSSMSSRLVTSTESAHLRHGARRGWPRRPLRPTPHGLLERHTDLVEAAATLTWRLSRAISRRVTRTVCSLRKVTKPFLGIGQRADGVTAIEASITACRPRDMNDQRTARDLAGAQSRTRAPAGKKRR